MIAIATVAPRIYAAAERGDIRLSRPAALGLSYLGPAAQRFGEHLNGRKFGPLTRPAS